MCCGNDDVTCASFKESIHCLCDGAGGIDHVIDNDACTTFNFTNNLADNSFVWYEWITSLMDKCDGASAEKF